MPVSGIACQSRDEVVRRRIELAGVVQGVGFRPFVYKLASTWGIKGYVLNSGEGVVIDAEGKRGNLEQFLRELKDNPPPLSNITHYHQIEMLPAGYTVFEIIDSIAGNKKEVLVPPDVAVCAECAREIFNPADRHYCYPFTNCTNCGPRFTIIREVPYDRPKTSMSSFQMCSLCESEYHNPGDRRFHAQPIACSACGPQVEIVDASGKTVTGGESWLNVCWDMIKSGKIIALKSLGGFHLVCDAKNKEALKTLRKKKRRPAKPFAIMCRNLEAVRNYCLVEEKEAAVLTSVQAPIVILKKREPCALPEELSPGLKTLGVMLPYTPLHLLLFSGPFDVLVMTSGNHSGLPLVKNNSVALTELGGIADCFVFHNREIINRCDDSVVQVIDSEIFFFRRSRGYVPYPVPIHRKNTNLVILGIGGEMKNSFCLLKGEQAFISQHIGEIDSIEGEQNLKECLDGFQRLLGIKPEVVACDAHPFYLSSELAFRIPARAHIRVQHHHAHLASCLAENGISDEEVIGVILDGTGYGLDGTLWGFEILIGGYRRFRRLCHLAYVPLPGGDAAIRQPWRSAVSYLLTFLGDEGKKAASVVFRGVVNSKDIDIIGNMIGSSFNSPLSSSCGRLFDAVSALLGICLENTYEGQAAIELGEMVSEDNSPNISLYHYEIKDNVIMPGEIIRGVVKDILDGLPARVISTKFHHTLAVVIVDAVSRIGGATRIKKVALSGGTWNNRYLFRTVKNMLSNRGFEVLYHRQVPAGDGGISLGQAVIADWGWI